MELIIMLIILAVTAGLCLIPTQRITFARRDHGLERGRRTGPRDPCGPDRLGWLEVIAIRNWLSCDSFGALILLLVSYVGLGTSIFSWGHMQRPDGAETASSGCVAITAFTIFFCWPCSPFPCSPRFHSYGSPWSSPRSLRYSW